MLLLFLLIRLCIFFVGEQPTYRVWAKYWKTKVVCCGPDQNVQMLVTQKDCVGDSSQYSAANFSDVVLTPKNPQNLIRTQAFAKKLRPFCCRASKQD